MCELVEVLGRVGIALQDLDSRAAELQKAIESAEANPLRNEKLLEDLRKKAAGLQKEFADFRADVDKLPDVLENGAAGDRGRPAA